MNKIILFLSALLIVTAISFAGAGDNEVNSDPTASFKLSTYSTTVDHQISLYDTSSGSPTSWTWTIKNKAGTTVFTSTSQNPTWTPSTAGQFSVMLNVSNEYGSDSITKSNNYLLVGSGTAYNSSDDQITWLGDEYNCGTWQMPIGPFYDDPRNVWVDVNNVLHLDLKKWSNVWKCGEVQGKTPFRYGIVRWTVESDRMNNVDHNVVMGTFTYNDTTPEGVYNELDLEATTWGDETPNRMTYTVQPGEDNGGPSTNAHAVQPFNVPANSQPMYFQIDWQPTRIIFSMLYANGTVCDSWNYTDTSYIPTFSTYTDMMVWATAAPEDGLPETLKVHNVQLSQSEPVTDFYANTTSGSSTLDVQFTDTSTNIPTSYNWDFGDGNTSISQNPEHVYTSSGTYTVTETTSNYYGSDAMTKTSYITIESDSNITTNQTSSADSNITTNQTSSAAPIAINFPNATLNNITVFSKPTGNTDISENNYIVLNIGDSITRGDFTEGGPSYVWGAVANNSLNAISPTWTFVNRGVNSEQTATELARTETELNTYKPDIMTIECGTNDITFEVSQATIINNILSMAQIAKSKGVQPVIILPPARSDEPYSTNVKNLDQALETQANEEGYQTINFWDAIDTSPGNGVYDAYNDSNYVDGLHPNDAGNVLLGAKVSTFLQGYTANGGWYDSNFTNRLRLTTDPAKVSNTDQENFTMYVNITEPVLKTQSNGGNVSYENGSDITMSLPNKILLDHEIQEYDPVNGRLIANVRLPKLSHTKNETVYINVGDGNTTTQLSTKTSTWDSHYKLVAHLNEVGTGNVNDFRDSTSHGNNNWNTAEQPTRVKTLNGKAQRFNGTSNFLDFGNDASLNPTTGYTLSFWAYINSIPSTSNVGVAGKSLDTYMMGIGYDQCVNVFVNWYYSFFSQYSVLRTPVYLTGTYDSVNGKLNISRDGNLIQSENLTGNIPTDSHNFTIGKAYPYSGYYDGDLSEVRLSDNVRSPDWTKTEYNNQYSPETFYSVSSESLGGQTETSYTIPCNELGNITLYAWDRDDTDELQIIINK